MSNEELLAQSSVQIHKKVLKEIIYSAVNDIDGVSLTKDTFINQAARNLGVGKYPGISVHVDGKENVSVKVRIYIRYGLNIPDMAKRVQDAVKEILDKSVHINLKAIDVNIQGIERGSR